MIVMQEEYLTPEEVSKQLRVEYDTVVRLCRLKKLPAVKVAGQWRITRADLAQYLQDHYNQRNKQK